MFFNIIKGEIIEAKTWKDEVLKKNIRTIIPRKRILVLTENQKEEFFEGEIIDAIDFAPGQRAIHRT